MKLKLNNSYAKREEGNQIIDLRSACFIGESEDNGDSYKGYVVGLNFSTDELNGNKDHTTGSFNGKLPVFLMKRNKKWD